MGDKLINRSIPHQLKTIESTWFERRAIEAAEGRIAIVTAKSLQTAREIPFQDACAWK